jgi:hypothetical protein
MLLVPLHCCHYIKFVNICTKRNTEDRSTWNVPFHVCTTHNKFSSYLCDICTFDSGRDLGYGELLIIIECYGYIFKFFFGLTSYITGKRNMYQYKGHSWRDIIMTIHRPSYKMPVVFILTKTGKCWKMFLKIPNETKNCFTHVLWECTENKIVFYVCRLQVFRCLTAFDFFCYLQPIAEGPCYNSFLICLTLR